MLGRPTPASDTRSHIRPGIGSGRRGLGIGATHPGHGREGDEERGHDPVTRTGKTPAGHVVGEDVVARGRRSPRQEERERGHRRADRDHQARRVSRKAKLGQAIGGRRSADRVPAAPIVSFGAAGRLRRDRQRFARRQHGRWRQVCAGGHARQRLGRHWQVAGRGPARDRRRIVRRLEVVALDRLDDDRAGGRRRHGQGRRGAHDAGRRVPLHGHRVLRPTGAMGR